ncbi:MAG: PAS domain S-box protein, partial [Candidatus Hodarchaeales archaeon]
SSPVHDADGNIIAVVEVDKDITERKKLEQELKNYTENLENIVDTRTQELKESEEKLNAILTGIADLITIQNRDLDIIWVNQPMRALYGDILGRKCYKVYKRLDEPCEDCYVESVFKEGKTVISERESILPGGSLIQVFITSSPVRDAEGNIIAILEVEKDITEQKKLERQLVESEAKQQAILRGIGDLITIQNKDLDIIWANQPIKEHWGDVVGKKCYKVYKCLDEPCPQCTVETVFNEGKTFVSEQLVINPNGKSMDTLVTSSPIRDEKGNIIAVVEIVKDITERKQLETQLKDYTDNLEKRVAERTKALKESEEKLRALLRGIGDRITIQNKNLEITWINQPVKNIFGDITGQKCYEAYKGLTEPCSDCYAGIVFNEEKTLISERTDIRPDGRHINTLVTSSPVKDAEGNVVAIIEVTKDITERKKMEQQLKEYTENLERIVDKRTKALKESEEKQKAILRGIGDRITIQNKDLDIIWANQVMKDIFGDITGQKCYEAYKGLTERCPDCTVEKVFKEEKTVVSEGIVISPEGEHSNILTTSSPVRDTEGNIAAVVEVVKDITERKKAEKKIKEYTENLEKLVEERTLDLKVSEEHYRGLYESSIDGIASLDMDGNIKECNQAYANMLGYTKDDLYNLTYQDLTPDRWYDMETKIITKQILPKGYSNVYEKEHIKKDGTIFPVSVRGWLIKDKEITPTGMWSIVRDISEQKKMERQLKKYTEDLEASEERYRGLYESSLDGIVFLDLEGNILECNQAFADMLEYTKKQLYNSNYRELFPSKLFDYVAKTLSDQMFTSGYSDELETEAIKKDGTILSVSVKAWRIKDKENKPIGTWTIVRDITEQKKLESQLKNYAENLEKLVEKRTEKLRESEERYRGLYKSSADGIFSADSERNIIECNQAFADMLGYTKEELYEFNFRDLTPRKWFDLVNGRIRKQVYTRGYSEEYEQEAIKKDGSIVPVSVRVWWVKDKEDRPIGMWGIIRDITERKRAEEKIKEYAEN